MGLIYCLTSPSGKKYVGKTGRTLEIRMRDYTHNSKLDKRPIGYAIKKYGLESFNIEVLADDIDDPGLLNVIEIEFIARYRQGGFTLYNMTDGGEGMLGIPCSDENRQGLIDRNNKNWADEKYRKKMSARQKEFMNRPENVEKYRAQGIAHAEKNKEAMRAISKEYHNRPEVKAALSERSKGSGNPVAILNEEKVIEIKRLLDLGINCSRIGAQFNVDRRRISSIKNGHTWGWLTGIEKRGKSTNITIPEQQATDQD